MKFSRAAALIVLLILGVFVQDSEQLFKKKKLKLLLGGAIVGGAVGGAVGFALGKHHHHPKIWIEKHHEPIWIVKDHGWHGGWDNGWHSGGGWESGWDSGWW